MAKITPFLTKIWSAIKEVVKNSSNWLIAIFTILNFLLYFGIFATSDLTVKADNTLFIGQQFESLTFTHILSLKNEGGKIGSITKVEGIIKSKNRDRNPFYKKLTSNYVFQNGFDKTIISSPYPTYFFEIPVFPNDVNVLNFQLQKTPDRNTLDSVSLLYSQILDEAESQERKSAIGLLNMTTISDSLRNIINNFITIRRQELTVGEYEYLIALTKDSDKDPFFVQYYTFTISPENISQLNEVLKDFNKAYRYFNGQRRLSVAIPLTLNENSASKKSLLKELRQEP